MFVRGLLMVGFVLVGALAAPAAAMAAIPISVVVITGSQCVSGTAPRNSEVVATLRTPDGHVRGRSLTESDDQGAWGVCFAGAINGGDSLRVVAGGRNRTIAIPRVEPQIDRVNNLIEGMAAPNTPVLAQIAHRKTLKKSALYQLDTISDGSGRYGFDTTAVFNLRGGDAVTVFTQSGNDLFGAIVLAPFIEVLQANNIVVGTANNGTDLVIELRDAHGNLKADVTAGAFPLFFGISLFEVSLYDDDGSAVYPIGGDQLTATLASDAILVLPRSALVGAASTDVVSGRCMADASYALNAGIETFYGTTDATGRFTRDVSSRMNLHRGDTLSLTCLYPSGDLWTRTGIAL